MYKNNCLTLGLNKGRCAFVTSDFPAENPRTQNRNYSYTKPLPCIKNTHSNASFAEKILRFKASFYGI